MSQGFQEAQDFEAESSQPRGQHSADWIDSQQVPKQPVQSERPSIPPPRRFAWVTLYLLVALPMTFFSLFFLPFLSLEDFFSVRSQVSLQMLERLGAMRVGAEIFSTEAWRLANSMALHGGFWHLAFNAFALALFGTSTERALGSFRFGAVYLLAGIASAASGAWSDAATISLGASGAILGVIAARLALEWNAARLKRGPKPWSLTVAVLLIVVGLPLVQPYFKSLATVGVVGHAVGFVVGVAVAVVFLAGSRSRLLSGLAIPFGLILLVVAAYPIFSILKLYYGPPETQSIPELKVEFEAPAHWLKLETRPGQFEWFERGFPVLDLYSIPRREAGSVLSAVQRFERTQRLESPEWVRDLWRQSVGGVFAGYLTTVKDKRGRPAQIWIYARWFESPAGISQLVAVRRPDEDQEAARQLLSNLRRIE